MKLQQVILKPMAGKLRWMALTEMIGITYRDVSGGVLQNFQPVRKEMA